MTNYRSTNEEKEQRINYAADQLAKGERSMVIVKKLAKRYSVSPQQARDYVREGRKVLNRFYCTKRSCFYLLQSNELFRTR